MTNAIKIVLASALLTAAAIKAAPALAEPLAPQHSVAVRIVETSDLDLTSSAGQRQLDIRLAHAAREVCGTASSVDLRGTNQLRKCRDEVLADARAQRRQMLAAAAEGQAIAVTAAR